MRIISGKYRGRQLSPPKNLPVRPTTNFAKEGIFNVLNNLLDFEGLNVLELFCGTGNVTFEFASRSVERITAIDHNPQCIRFINKTIIELDSDNVFCLRQDVFQFISKTKLQFDLIFADPPFDLNSLPELPQQIMQSDLLSDNAWLVLEHGSKLDLSEEKGFEMSRKYGHVNFSLFQKPKMA